MSLDMVFRIAGIGILVGIMAILLNESGKKELANLVTLSGIIVVLYMVVQGISDLFALVKSVFQLY